MTLHSGLRAAWASSETGRAELVAVLADVGVGLWHSEPGPGRWSVAQQADHLLRAEIGTSKMVRRLIRGDFRGLVRPAEAKLYDSTLSYPFGPATAPTFLQPAGLAAEQALEGLAAAHARFFAELRRFQGEDPDALVSPDPASDFWFTLAGWVRVQALHEAHHVALIEDVSGHWARTRSSNVSLRP